MMMAIWLSGTGCLSANTGRMISHEKQVFDRDWRFNRIDRALTVGWGAETDTVRDVDLPHDWSIALPLEEAGI